jgi:hypothetical protein
MSTSSNPTNKRERTGSDLSSCGTSVAGDELGFAGSQWHGLEVHLREVRRELFLAACQNDATAIARALSCFDPEDQQELLTWQARSGRQRFTPMIYAALYANVESVRALLSFGNNAEEQANTRGSSAKRQTALHYACSDLEKANNPRTSSREGRNVVTDAARASTIRLLLAHGADPNLQDMKNGYTPMDKAVWNRLADCQQVLIEGNADVTLSDSRVLAAGSQRTHPSSQSTWRSAAASQPPRSHSQPAWRCGEKISPSGGASMAAARTDRTTVAPRPVAQPLWRSTATSQPPRPHSQPTWRRGEKVSPSVSASVVGSAGSWDQRSGFSGGGHSGSYGGSTSGGSSVAQRRAQQSMQECSGCGKIFPKGGYSGSYPRCWDCR